MVKIAFLHNQLDVRGSCVAMYDYALYNEKLLENKSIITVPEESKKNNEIIAVLKFTNRFPVFFYRDMNHLDEILQEQGCDILYCIKFGKRNGIVSKKVKTVVHCVFDLSEPHGDVYAAVSKTLADKYKSPLYVPHMIGLPPSITGDNLREELKIPKDAVVFGRHGGMDTFNVGFCHKVIRQIVNERENAYFVFINTPRFYIHPKIHYLPKITSDEEKNRFISTCDAHLECGTLGHSFGLSMGEFSVNNKPIIAYNSPKLWNRSHLDILGDKAILYTCENEFYTILKTFDPNEYKNKDMNCYKDYSPEKVMEIFDRVFVGKLK